MTRRPAHSHSLFPVAESGEDAQVGGLGEDNRVASWDRGHSPGPGSRAWGVSVEAEPGAGETGAAGRLQTQGRALSRKVAVFSRGGACEVGVSAATALKARAPRCRHRYV